jgi:hypothetical protein
LQTATNGGGASHVVRRFASTASGHEAWQALLAWYEGPIMSGKIVKTLRTKLWVQSKNGVNKHINDFTLYMDQLKELGRDEREETLTNLFLDSILDPKFEVMVTNCWLRDDISIHECFEAIRKYDNVTSREGIQDEASRQKIRRLNNNTRQVSKIPDKQKIDTSYRTYKEWQKLSAEERSKILEARDVREKDRNTSKEEVEREEHPTEDSQNKNIRQRNHRHTRRQVNSGNEDSEHNATDRQYQGDDEVL